MQTALDEIQREKKTFFILLNGTLFRRFVSGFKYLFSFYIKIYGLVAMESKSFRNVELAHFYAIHELWNGGFIFR